MKIMISQPMTGKLMEQIYNERADLIAQFEKEGHEVLDTILPPSDEAEKNPLYFIAKSIEIMGFADLVVFMPGWQASRGCRIEHEVAKSYGLNIKELKE